MQRSLKGGTIASYLWVIVHIGVNLLYTPILISMIGKSEYGLYQIVASFFAYINIFETSISVGVLRFYCNAKAAGNKKEMENVLAIARQIYRIFSIITVLVGIIVITAFRRFYVTSFSSQEIAEGSVMLILLFFNLLITMSNAVYLAGINANERFVFVKTLAMCSQIVQPALCVLILLKLPYAPVVIAVQVSVNLIVAFIRYFYAKKRLYIKVELHEKNKHLAKQLLIFSASILLSQIADQIFWKTDQIILGKFYSTAIVAVYAIGAQIYTNYMYAGTTVASVFFPRISRCYQEEDGLKKISALFIKVGRIAFLLCFLVLTGFIIFGKEFIQLWVGQDFVQAYYMAVIVMIPFTIDIIQNIGLTILQVMDRYGFRAKMYFVAAILNVVLTCILAYYFGGFGAALSTGITMFITSGIILNIFYAKTIKLEIASFWKNILALLGKISPVVILSWILNQMLSFHRGFIVLGAKIIVYVLCFGLAAYFFAMNDYEKGICRSFLNKVRGKR